DLLAHRRLLVPSSCTPGTRTNPQDSRQPLGLVLHPPQHSPPSPALPALPHIPPPPRFGLLCLAPSQCSVSVYMVITM
ncbi:hypothetical protein C0993_001264, partial [Termitomyces sp. T159_Od127]